MVDQCGAFQGDEAHATEGQRENLIHFRLAGFNIACQYVEQEENANTICSRQFATRPLLWLG